MKSPSELVHTQLSQAVGDNNDNLGRVYNARKQLEAEKTPVTNKDVVENTKLNNGVVSRAFVQLDAIFYGNISKKPWAADRIISKCNSIIDRKKNTLSEDAVEWLNYVISTAKEMKHSRIEEYKMPQLADRWKNAVDKKIETRVTIDRIFKSLPSETTLSMILSGKKQELVDARGSDSPTIEDEIEELVRMETDRRAFGSLDTMAGIIDQGYIELLKNHEDLKVGKTADAIKVDEKGAILKGISLTTSNKTKNHDGKNGVKDFLKWCDNTANEQKGKKPVAHSLVIKSGDLLREDEETNIFYGSLWAYFTEETGDPYSFNKVLVQVREMTNKNDIYAKLQQYHEEGLRRAFPAYTEWVATNCNKENPFKYNETLYDFLWCLTLGDNCPYCGEDGWHKVSAKKLVTCIGETKKGEKCNNMIVSGHFCGVHARTT